MWTSILEVGDLKQDAAYRLHPYNYGFKGLLLRDVTLSAHFGHATLNVLRVELWFCLALVIFLAPSPWISLIALLVLAIAFAIQAAALVLLFASVVLVKTYKPGVWQSLFFWSWRLMWTLLFCILGAAAGVFIGWYLWLNNIRTYRAIGGMESYKDIDPSIVPGIQIADAGLVQFSELVDVDRARGGCFMHSGDTYCVAPITHGGRIRDNLGDAPRYGSYDYFAVGINCCNCPNQDFQCGEWRNPLANGGVRSTDYVSRPFFRLAVDEWSAQWLKVSTHPIFFEWVQDPVYHWRALWYDAVHLCILAAFFIVPIVFCATLALERLLQFFIDIGYASRLNTPGPPRGLERSWRRLLPEMLEQHFEEKRQQEATGIMGYHTMAACLPPGALPPQPTPGAGIGGAQNHQPPGVGQPNMGAGVTA